MSSHSEQKAFREKWEFIRQARLKGLYTIEDTREEAMVCLRRLRETPTDWVITLVARLGAFQVADARELMTQIRLWQRLKVVLLKCNIKEVDAGACGKVTLFTVQPPDLKDAPMMCPLAMAFGVWVTGFSYMCLGKAPPELVWAALGRKE